MADSTSTEFSSRPVTRLQWSSPFPPGIAFSQGDEGGPDKGGVEATREGLLSEERALLPETVHPRRLLEFTLGRSRARAALASLEPSLAGVPILRAGRRNPRWPEGYVGAITHHKGRAAAAVARQGDYAGLGLDLEAQRAMSEGMRRRLLRPEERERLEGLAEAEADLRAMIVFSAKESIYKCLQPVTGIYLGFQDAEVLDMVETAPDRGALRWRLHKDCGPRFPGGYEGVGTYALQPGFVLTGVWVPAG